MNNKEFLIEELNYLDYYDYYDDEDIEKFEDELSGEKNG